MSQEYSVFQKALTDSVLKEYAQISNDITDDSHFSPAFRTWTLKTIRKTQRRSWYYVNTSAKKVILIAIIISILAITAMAIPTIRKKVIEFFVDEHEDHLSITFNEKDVLDAPDRIDVVYLPCFLPDGYYQNDQTITSSCTCFSWQNAEEQQILYSQSLIPENPNDDQWIGIDSEDVVRSQINIGEYQVTLFTDANFQIAAWTDDSYFYTLHMPPDISLDTMEQIILSIEPLK